MDGCRQVTEHLDAYADAELEPSTVVDFEGHLERCPQCREQLQLLRATKHAVHDQLSGVTAPASLQLRVQHALDDEDGRPTALRRWSLVAAAAAVALGVVQFGGNPGGAMPWTPAHGTNVQAGLIPIFQDVVERHRDGLPPEVQATEGNDRVAGWFRGKVGFRVQAPRFNRPEMRLLGARVSHVRTQRAAKLVYRWGDRQVTMVVFPSTPELKPYLGRSQDASALGIRRERFGDREITYYTLQGYTVPIIEHDGIAYAFTGDLDRRELLSLVSSAQLP